MMTMLEITTISGSSTNIILDNVLSISVDEVLVNSKPITVLTFGYAKTEHQFRIKESKIEVQGMLSALTNSMVLNSYEKGEIK